eukprot:6421681-Pyramimonas_sp.AAC.2
MLEESRLLEEAQPVGEAEGVHVDVLEGEHVRGPRVVRRVSEASGPAVTLRPSEGEALRQLLALARAQPALRAPPHIRHRRAGGVPAQNDIPMITNHH